MGFFAKRHQRSGFSLGISGGWLIDTGVIMCILYICCVCFVYNCIFGIFLSNFSVLLVYTLVYLLVYVLVYFLGFCSRI